MRYPTIGTRGVCARCGMDIEHHGHGQWLDHGASTRCNLPHDTERLHPKGRHTPNLTPSMLLRRSYARIEVPRPRNRRPSYTWVTGWEVQDPTTGRWSIAMRFRDAVLHAETMLKLYRATI